MTRKILLFGATGNTGIEICKTLDTKNIDYFVFARKESASKLNTPETTIILGDALQASDVNEAIKDHDFTDIIIALGSRNFRGGEIRYFGTKNIVDALNANGKSAKIHVISANGVGNSWKNLKWIEKMICKLFISKAMKDHELQEEIVVSNTGGHHIIRPVGLTNDPGTGNILAEEEKPLINSKISRSNLANYLVESMINNISGKHSICDAL
jgi:uncharacterized protein YbjT (DUF2867 family)